MEKRANRENKNYMNRKILVCIFAMTFDPPPMESQTSYNSTTAFITCLHQTHGLVSVVAVV
jgi:hypothetical protein